MLPGAELTCSSRKGNQDVQSLQVVGPQTAAAASHAQVSAAAEMISLTYRMFSSSLSIPAPFVFCPVSRMMKAEEQEKEAVQHKCHSEVQGKALSFIPGT